MPFFMELKMSILHKTFKSDGDLEKAGIILQYGTVTRDGKEVPVNIRIARAGGSNTKFDKVFENKTKPYKRLIQTDALDKKVSEKIMREVYAETVILGWDNVQDKNDKFLDFTLENVLTLITDLPDLFLDIVTQAQKQSLFREEIIEADSKN